MNVVDLLLLALAALAGVLWLIKMFFLFEVLKALFDSGRKPKSTATELAQRAIDKARRSAAKENQ